VRNVKPSYQKSRERSEVIQIAVRLRSRSGHRTRISRASKGTPENEAHLYPAISHYIFLHMVDSRTNTSDETRGVSEEKEFGRYDHFADLNNS